MGEEDELEAMFKPKKKRRAERDQKSKKDVVETLLARMEVTICRVSCPPCVIPQQYLSQHPGMFPYAIRKQSVRCQLPGRVH